jgi:tripartite-type tricarboxylate transporter receptor subunit TctC
MAIRSITRLGRWLLAALGFVLSVDSHLACANETFPTRPIQFVLPQPAGGSVDSVARTLANFLSPRLGQPVVIDSRPGANGSLAAEYVARATPDGHTLYVAVDTNLTINPHLYSSLRYDPYRDFAPISVVVLTPIALLANPSLKADSIPELIALAKAQPGAINYASVGYGSLMHLGMEYLKSAAGFDVTHVPYKGASTALPDLFRGTVSLMLLNEQAAATYTRSGQIKTLAVTSLHRSKLIPQVPAIAETIPDFEFRGWVGVLAPAKTPDSIRASLVRAIQGVIAMPEFVDAIAKQGLVPVGSAPEEMTALMRKDSAKWGKVIRDVGVKVE